MALLYADEDFPHPAADAIRLLGHDVLTALADGQRIDAALTKHPDLHGQLIRLTRT